MDIKCLFLLLILSSSLHAKACELNKKIVSLSGPLTTLLEELTLLKSKNLLAVSSLTPLSSNSIVQTVSGGMFISNKVLDKYSMATFFYDKSFELTKTIKRSSITAFNELETIGMSPFEVVNYLIKEISPYLNGCESKISKLNKELKVRKKRIKSKLVGKKLIFFLGEIDSRKKLPELVIANDGFSKFLISNSIIESYPSSLAYLSWSKKIINRLQSQKYTFIGISQTTGAEDKVVYIDQKYLNIYMTGGLIPGLKQIKLLESISNLKL